MILFNNQLLFVHNPKTAGTSLLNYLGKLLSGPVHYGGVKEVGTYHPSLSHSLNYACAVTGNRPQDFHRIISVIRNPFDRELSMYVYFRDVLCNSASLAHDLNDRHIERIVRIAGKLSFDDYLARIYSELGTCDIWKSKYFYRTAEGGVPSNLRILKTENLDEDLAEALRGIELAKNIANIPRLNTSPRTSADVYRNARSLEIVAQSYEWIFADGYYDIDSFRIA